MVAIQPLVLRRTEMWNFIREQVGDWLTAVLLLAVLVLGAAVIVAQVVMATGR